MKINSIKRLLLIVNLFVISGISAAQETSCNHISTERQKACFEQLVAFNLSELIEYPEIAKQQGIEGKVYVRFTTDENFEIGNILILSNSDEKLNAAVIEAVQKLSEQNQIDKIMASSVYRFPVNFSLEY